MVRVGESECVRFNDAKKVTRLSAQAGCYEFNLTIHRVRMCAELHPSTEVFAAAIDLDDWIGRWQCEARRLHSEVDWRCIQIWRRGEKRSGQHQ